MKEKLIQNILPPTKAKYYNKLKCQTYTQLRKES